MRGRVWVSGPYARWRSVADWWTVKKCKHAHNLLEFLFQLSAKSSSGLAYCWVMETGEDGNIQSLLNVQELSGISDSPCHRNSGDLQPQYAPRGVCIGFVLFGVWLDTGCRPLLHSVLLPDLSSSSLTISKGWRGLAHAWCEWGREQASAGQGVFPVGGGGVDEGERLAQEDVVPVGWRRLQLPSLLQQPEDLVEVLLQDFLGVPLRK